MNRPATYAFGDNLAASRRLAALDEVFGPFSDALLADVETLLADAPRRVLDLGCGPGHTTARLARCFPTARVRGIDQSEVFVAESRTAGLDQRCRFEVGDVTEPLAGPADVVYARFLVSHLPHGAAAVYRWCEALAPSGVLLLEEPDHIASSDPDFAAYLAITAARVAETGADLYAGAVLGRMPEPLGARRLIDRVISPDLTAAQAASMFVPNLEAGVGHDRPEVADLLARLRTRLTDATRGLFRWDHRQIVLQRTST